MWLTHFWHSWSQFFIFAWDVTAGGILRTGVLICLVLPASRNKSHRKLLTCFSGQVTLGLSFREHKRRNGQICPFSFEDIILLTVDPGRVISKRWIFLNENSWILINISLKFVPQVPINDIPVLVQIMAWRPSGNKPLPEPMLTQIYVAIWCH